MSSSKWWWRIVHFFSSIQGAIAGEDELTAISRIRGWPSDIDAETKRAVAVRSARARGWVLSREDDEIVALSTTASHVIAESPDESVLWAVAAHNAQLLPDLTRA